MSQFRIEWIDRHREPQCPPDPRYPDGIDLPAPAMAKVTCQVDLPYPAKRCGLYVVKCVRCGMTVACTTAGRPDDPRSMQVPCLGMEKVARQLDLLSTEA
jgi:hypothetical protein